MLFAWQIILEPPTQKPFIILLVNLQSDFPTIMQVDQLQQICSTTVAYYKFDLLICKTIYSIFPLTIDFAKIEILPLEAPHGVVG